MKKTNLQKGTTEDYRTRLKAAMSPRKYGEPKRIPAREGGPLTAVEQAMENLMPENAALRRAEELKQVPLSKQNPNRRK
jgi:hypothetical protein